MSGRERWDVLWLLFGSQLASAGFLGLLGLVAYLSEITHLNMLGVVAKPSFDSLSLVRYTANLLIWSVFSLLLVGGLSTVAAMLLVGLLGLPRSILRLISLPYRARLRFSMDPNATMYSWAIVALVITLVPVVMPFLVVRAEAGSGLLWLPVNCISTAERRLDALFVLGGQLAGLGLLGWIVFRLVQAVPTIHVFGLLAACTMLLLFGFVNVPLIYGTHFIPNSYPPVEVWMRRDRAPGRQPERGLLITLSGSEVTIYRNEPHLPAGSRLSIIGRDTVERIVHLGAAQKIFSDCSKPKIETVDNWMIRLVPLTLLPLALLLSAVGPATAASSRADTNPDDRPEQTSPDVVDSPKTTATATGFVALLQTFYPFVEQALNQGVSMLEELTLFLRSDAPDPVSPAGRPQDIWEFDPVTGRFTQLTSDGTSTSPLPGANGALIFLRNGTIAIRPGPHVEPSLVPTSADPFCQLLGWNAEAGWILAEDRDRQVWMVNQADGELRRVVLDANEHPYALVETLRSLAATTPDLHQVRVMQRDQNWQVVLDHPSFEEPKVLIRCNEPIGDPALNPDGRLLFFSCGKGDCIAATP